MLIAREQPFHRFALVGGAGEGTTKLNAFDVALLEAGVGNANLVKLSSILPPGVQQCARSELDIPPGALLPIAYGAITSAQVGDVISAGVAVGIGRDTHGVIMESSGPVERGATERHLLQMVEEAFARRRLPLADIVIEVAQHTVARVGCAFAGVVLWY